MSREAALRPLVNLTVRALAVACSLIPCCCMDSSVWLRHVAVLQASGDSVGSPTACAASQHDNALGSPTPALGVRAVSQMQLTSLKLPQDSFVINAGANVRKQMSRLQLSPPKQACPALLALWTPLQLDESLCGLKPSCINAEMARSSVHPWQWPTYA